MKKELYNYRLSDNDQPLSVLSTHFSRIRDCLPGSYGLEISGSFRFKRKDMFGFLQTCVTGNLGEVFRIKADLCHVYC